MAEENNNETPAGFDALDPTAAEILDHEQHDGERQAGTLDENVPARNAVGAPQPTDALEERPFDGYTGVDKQNQSERGHLT